MSNPMDDFDFDLSAEREAHAATLEQGRRQLDAVDEALTTQRELADEYRKALQPIITRLGSIVRRHSLDAARLGLLHNWYENDHGTSRYVWGIILNTDDDIVVCAGGSMHRPWNDGPYSDPVEVRVNDKVIRSDASLADLQKLGRHARFLAEWAQGAEFEIARHKQCRELEAKERQLGDVISARQQLADIQQLA